MNSYGNPKTGITGYEVGEDYIVVRFKDGTRYRYTNDSAGPGNVATMKTLAESGSGLNAYINRHVKYKYASKG